MLLFYSQRIIGLLARRLTMPSLRSHIKAGSNYYITLNGTGELERPMEIGTHLSFSPSFPFFGIPASFFIYAIDRGVGK